MSIYIILKRRKDVGITLPYFDVSLEQPILEDQQKLLVLESGECVDVANFGLSEDMSYITAHHYRISNIDNQLHQEMIETYSLPRYGR